MKYQLAVIAGPESGRHFMIQDGQSLTIGRGHASDTQINDPCISRVHCDLRFDAGQLHLRDQGSSTGTLVNGRPVQDAAVESGDIIQIGDSKLRLQREGAQERSTLPGRQMNQAIRAESAAPLQSLVGENFGPYLLESVLSKGHSGMVFRARDTEQGQLVAVKVLAAEYAGTEEARQRFVRAMKTMLPVQHDHIVRLLAAGKQGAHCWAAMEHVEGSSLSQVIEDIGTAGMLDWRHAFRVAVHMCRALDYAEGKKIIHRNLTPNNILQRKQDKATKLADLMLAKAIEGNLAKSVTLPGNLVGDVPYMSPERTRQTPDIDGRSDIYQLGATLYALLTGRPPFEGNSLPTLIGQVREDSPVPPKEFHLAVPDRFQDLVLTMLAKRPADRYRDARAVLDELHRIGMYVGIDSDTL